MVCELMNGHVLVTLTCLSSFSKDYFARLASCHMPCVEFQRLWDFDYLIKKIFALIIDWTNTELALEQVFFQSIMKVVIYILID